MAKIITHTKEIFQSKLKEIISNKELKLFMIYQSQWNKLRIEPICVLPQTKMGCQLHTHRYSAHLPAQWDHW
jgi:hypothetical protein